MGQFLRQYIWSTESLILLVGYIGGVLTVWTPRFLVRFFLRRDVQSAYLRCELALEPEIVDPSMPGHPPAWASQARNKVNVLIPRLINEGFNTPSKCTREEESLREWFECLGDVRISIAKRRLFF